MVGDVVLQFLHTPGHTPEHISILVHQPAQPARIFTGDTLFVGAVGRPDLLGEELTRQLAGELYDSLFHKLLALDSAIEVHPGHGAGSLCGAGIGSEPHSTIGQERRFNPMLQHASRDSFVAAVLADLPETPPYFPRMKRLNHDGPAVLGLLEDVAAPPVFSPGQAAEALRGGALLVDLRQPDAFGAGHPAGALNIAFGSRVGYWAGWVLPPDARVVLLADGGAGQALEARRQLMRVGSDAVEGRLESFDAWRDAGLPIGHVLQISARDLRDRVHRGDTLTILDVRTRREFQRGHVDGAVHIPVGEIADRAAEIPRRRPVATVCEGGFRSSLAASLLARAGVASVVNVTGGMSAYRALEGTA
jgi:hydroxyacylglutathione hydrolase